MPAVPEANGRNGHVSKSVSALPYAFSLLETIQNVCHENTLV